MVRKTPLAFAVCTLLAGAPQAFASFDMEDCKWSDASCLLKGIPVLSPENDTRDNLLRLLSQKIIHPAGAVTACGCYPLPRLLFCLSSTVG